MSLLLVEGQARIIERDGFNMWLQGARRVVGYEMLSTEVVPGLYGVEAWKVDSDGRVAIDEAPGTTWHDDEAAQRMALFEAAKAGFLTRYVRREPS